MNRTHIYTVHINPTVPYPYEAAEFVEEGFSWKAFFFTSLWALYHRLWLAAIGFFVVNVAVLALYQAGYFTHIGAGILLFGFDLWIGYQGNDWVRAKLRRRGYITSDVTSGDSLLRGQQRFYDRYFLTHSSALPV